VENKNKLSSPVLGGMVFLITFAVFTGALDNDFVNYDDDKYVYENPVINSLETGEFWNLFAGMHHFNYWHPMAWFSHALDYKYYKLDPWGYHLTSVIIHAMTVSVVYFLFVKLIGAARPTFRNGWNLMIAAFLSALVYGLHPLRVEPVVWIAERKEVLSGFFYFSGLLTYLHYISVESKRSRFLCYSGTLLLFCLSLMSKPHVVTFPLILILLDWFPLRRLEETGNRWAVLLEKVPYFALSISFSVATMILQKGGGAVKTLEEVTAGQRLWNAVRSLSFYLEKTLWPFPLVPFYPLEESPSVFMSPFLFSSVVILGLSYACLYLWRKGKGVYLVVWVYYLIAVFPAIGLVQVGGQAAADRFSYSTTLSFYFFLGIGLLWILENKRDFRFHIRIKLGVITSTIVVLVLLGFLTHRQIEVWRNGETLWSKVIQYFPNRIFHAHYNFGNSLLNECKYHKAIAQYEKALNLIPNNSITHSNLGIALAEQKNIDDAMFHLNEAIRLNPGDHKSFNYLGMTLSRIGQTYEALAHYREAIKLKPTFAEAYYNLGLALGQQRRVDEAIINFNKAISLKPDYAEAHSDLGIAISISGNPEEAISHFKEAISINPNLAVAYLNFGNTLAQQGKFEESIIYLEKALNIDSELAQAHYILGRVLSIVGKDEDAEKHLNLAGELKGN